MSVKVGAKQHKLERTKKIVMPGRIVFVDTETIPTEIDETTIKQVFRLGVACYWRMPRGKRKEIVEWFEFTTKSAFWDWLLGHTTVEQKLYLVAHNAAFDLLVLDILHEIPPRGWLMWNLYEKGMTYLLDVGLPTEKFQDWIDDGQDVLEFDGTRWRKTIKVVDNANLYPGTIEALGKSIGSPKLAMPDQTDDVQAWFTYCRQDVEVMHQAWRRRFEFLRVNGLGSFKPTVASQSFEAYRHRFLPCPIDIHRIDAVLRLERETYRGGRTECFFVGRPPADTVYKLDINSMYPYIMRRDTYPCELVGYREAPSRTFAWNLLRRYAVVAAVDMVTPDPIFPIQQNGKNVYPVGHLNTVLTTNEFKLAFERGWIREIYELAWYRQTDLFTEFVDYFYEKKVASRQAGDDTDYLFSKLILNSSYGKWGQKGRTNRIIGTCDPDEMYVEHGIEWPTQKSYTYTYLCGLVIESREDGEAFNSFPAIAAHVTANARLYLWSLFEQAGRENVYYCDTDSVFTNRVGRDRLADLLDPDRLGYLKIEGESDDVVLHAPKDYEWSGVRTLKGVPKDAAIDGTHGFVLTYWPSFTTHLESKLNDTFYNYVGHRRPKRVIDWGMPLDDGWIVPFALG